MTDRISGLNRRQLITASGASLVTFADGIARPGISRANARPMITHGLQSGDVSSRTGVVWTRVDRPARVTFDITTTDAFKTVQRSVFVDALPESDFTAKVTLDNLPVGQDIFYRVRTQALEDGAAGEPNTTVAILFWAGAKLPRPNLGHVLNPSSRVLSRSLCQPKQAQNSYATQTATVVLRSGAFAPPRRTGATSASCGRATRRARGGGSTRPVGACASTIQC